MVADALNWIILLLGALGGYWLYKLFNLYRADGDLVTLSKSMRPEYFKGKVVWVTGASSGIGAEMCRQLSKMEAKIILSARNKEKMTEVVEKLDHPDQARILPVDLSNPEETRAATEKALELFGRVDILVNNAGVSTRAMFLEVQEQVHRKVMEVDFFSAWILTHDTLPGMVANKFGHVVNISSIWGKVGPSNRSSYSSAKFAIAGLMDCVRNEMLCNNVSVTNVFPGPVITMAGANALTGDGTAVGKNDSLIAAGMSVERCVELTLIGVSNKLYEVWVSPQPYLMYPYYAHYCPSILKYIIEKRARHEIEVAKKKTE